MWSAPTTRKCNICGVELDYRDDVEPIGWYYTEVQGLVIGDRYRIFHACKECCNTTKRGKDIVLNKWCHPVIEE